MEIFIAVAVIGVIVWALVGHKDVTHEVQPRESTIFYEKVNARKKMINILSGMSLSKDRVLDFLSSHEVRSEFIKDISFRDNDIIKYLNCENGIYYNGKTFGSTEDFMLDGAICYIYGTDIFSELLADRIKEIATEHLDILSKKKNQTIDIDDYGNIIVKKWYLELSYFIENVIRKDNIFNDYIEYISSNDEMSAGFGLIYKILDNHVDLYQESASLNQVSISDVEEMTPVEFEHLCANILRNSGWRVKVTQASCDQGIDIVGRLGEITAVFQCKKYSHPVGNAAVQEIIAGKAFEQADKAIVVSNTSYTQSAKQLANATDVLLLHYNELVSLGDALLKKDGYESQGGAHGGQA